MNNVVLFSIPLPLCGNPSKHFPSELGEPTPGDGKAEVWHPDFVKIPCVVSRFVPVDQPREASALFDYDVAWSEVWRVKTRSYLDDFEVAAVAIKLDHVAFVRGMHRAMPGPDGSCQSRVSLMRRTSSSSESASTASLVAMVAGRECDAKSSKGHVGAEGVDCRG